MNEVNWNRMLSAPLVLALACVIAPSIGLAQEMALASGGPHALVVVKDGRFLAGAGEEATEIVDLTLYCLDCHGGDATGDSAEDAPKPEHTVTGMGRSHPVDVAYPDGAEGYHPQTTVTEKLPLRDGRMTCLSCHSGTPDRELILPLKGSHLCIVCHAK